VVGGGAGVEYDDQRGDVVCILDGQVQVGRVGRMDEVHVVMCELFYGI